MKSLRENPLLKKAFKPVTIALLMLLALSLSTVVYTYQLPLELELKKDIASYSHEANYQCVAELKPNIVYEKTILPLEDKVFLKLVKNINVTLTYKFQSSPQAEKTLLTCDLKLVVSNPGLWSKSFTLNKIERINSTSFNYNLSIDMGWTSSLISNISREIGIYSSKYDVEVKALISMSAKIADREVNESFTPTLRLSLDYGGGVMSISGMHYEDTSTISRVERRSAYLQVLGVMVKVSNARGIAQNASIAFTAALGFMLIALKPRIERDECKVIAKKYGDVIIDVEAPPKAQSLIKVKEFKDLFKVAQGAEKPILHVNIEGEHQYYVVTNTDAYLYEANKRSRNNIQD